QKARFNMYHQSAVSMWCKIDAVQNFFFEEVHLAEQLFRQGYIDVGVFHLATAVVFHRHPYHYLSDIQHRIYPDVFQRLLQILPTVSQNIWCGEAGERLSRWLKHNPNGYRI
ncbi:unnamed protein product, partial [Owenia fusiformis]